MQAFGYTDISSIGRLKISPPQSGQAVSVLQKTGALFPPKVGPSNPKDVSTTIAMEVARAGGPGRFIRGTPVIDSRSMGRPALPKAGPTALEIKAMEATALEFTALSASVIPIGVAYWFGTDIVLEDNAVVLLDSDLKSLVIIAETLTVGQNVSISWARPPATWPAVPAKPPTPPDWEQATTVGSERGRDGSNGLPGGQGPHG
ncbi:MAG TPA: hypothetical protein VD861_01695, partial [Pyrinomonadaceae bacterium]|nr:hypothetical protein [Pyrinomonadaceae bacterium]